MIKDDYLKSEIRKINKNKKVSPIETTEEAKYNKTHCRTDSKQNIKEELFDHDKLVESKMKSRRCMFRNGHGCQEKWDVFVMLLAVYNSFTIPLQVAFHLHSMDYPVYILVDVIINIVFICDMLVNFRTTFIDEESGEEVTDPKEIAVNYLKSRFKIDLIGVLPWDDIARFCIGLGSSHSVNWIILIKMIRVLKVYDVISSLKVKEETKVAVQLVKILYLFVLYLHCHGCAWYYIVEQDEHWYPPIEYWHGEKEFYEGEDLFKYFNCLLHALLMFGGDDIGPSTTFQIVWCCSCIFAGAMLEALLFGKFADLAMEMNKKENLQEEKQDMVNSAIKSLAIPEKLQLKIEGFLAYTQETLESQNELKSFFSVISPSLKEQVVQHIFEEPLFSNPVFNFDDKLVKKLTKQMEIQVNSPEDVVVEQGTVGDHLFVISKGEFVVLVKDHESTSHPTSMLRAGDFFGEVALLFNCSRTATVKANNYATIAKVDKKSFQSLCREFEDLVPKLRNKIKSYNDSLKQFLVSIVKVIPYFSDLGEYTLEDIAYHMKQKFYDKGEIVFNQGESMNGAILIVTKGELELLYKVDGKEFRMHILGQGCYIGAYQIHANYNHTFTARALCKTTVHRITKDSIEHLSNEIPQLRTKIEETIKYSNTTQDPIVSFGFHRGFKINVKDVFKLSVGRVICIKRDMKQSCISYDMNLLLNETKTNSNIMKQSSLSLDFTDQVHMLLLNLSKQVDKRFEKFNERIIMIEKICMNNQNQFQNREPLTSEFVQPVKLKEIKSPKNKAAKPKVKSSKITSGGNNANPNNSENAVQNSQSKIKSMFYSKANQENETEGEKDEEMDSAEISPTKFR